MSQDKAPKNPLREFCFTHCSECADPPWIAIHRESALSLLSGYDLTDQQKNDVFYLMEGYCRLLDDAGLVFVGHTEQEAIMNALGIPLPQ